MIRSARTSLATMVVAFSLAAGTVTATAAPVPGEPAAPAQAPAPTARPAVTPTITEVEPAAGQLQMESRPADLPAGRQVVAYLPARDVGTFQLVGASWTGLAGTDPVVQARTKGADGWSPWWDLELADGAERPVGTDPVYVGASTGVEMRVLGDATTRVAGFKAVLVDSPATPDDERQEPLTPEAIGVQGVPQPSIITRAQWGADESMLALNGADCVPANLDQSVRAAVVHHTAGSNSYTAAQSASIVRGIYSYHVRTLRWCDIGYNFLVDKYGQRFEGRHGGMDLPVHGAHATLWNTNTVGVSVMMNSSKQAASDAAMDSMAAIIAWKLAGNYRDPNGRVTLAGKNLPTIFGHGDVMATDCPGTDIRNRMGELRSRVTTKMAGKQGGSIRALWSATGGANGPLGEVHRIERTLGGGLVTQFTKGFGYARPDGQAFWLGTTLNAQYADLGGPTGAYGWPTSSQTTRADGSLAATFERGRIPFDPAGVSFAAASTFRPLAPGRVIDTRTTRQVPAMGELTVPVAGRAGVPASGAVAVVATVTAVNARAEGHFRVWPSGEARPNASTLNFPAGRIVANSATMRLGSDGAIKVLNHSPQPIDVLVDVSGYLTAGAPTSGGGFRGVVPNRLLDTRSTSIVPALGQVDVTAAGVAGVPRNATAVVLNVTVTEPQQEGHLRAWATGGAMPNASYLNFVRGQTVAGQVVVPVGAGGKVTLANRSTAPAHYIADVVGYVTGSGSGGSVSAAASPVRVLDTRTGNGYSGSIAGRQSIRLKVAGRAGVPASGVSAVLVNVTVTEPAAPGFITVSPGGEAVPLASNLNFVRGTTVANAVLAKVGSDGTILLTNGSTDRTHLVVDLTGYVA